MLEGKNVQEVVEREIRAVLLSDDEPISPQDALLDSGLNSLMLAQLLLQLEAELGVDPFAGALSIADVRTVGDLVDVYERALAAAAGV
ncbi:MULTISPECIES: phosphopantetheine-binding protein [unclassified Streptomyces]|uniref:phosphopantetheine-binding protein n=1 Tax=unclassified Streptomyces TaxID=2593676 RepID=UPI002E2C3981|nr:phosphopantetheine-binding protein [Streptomyces sp. NBC_00223]